MVVGRKPTKAIWCPASRSPILVVAMESTLSLAGHVWNPSLCVCPECGAFGYWGYSL